MKHESPRRHVVELCLELSRRGYFAGTGGNLMLRIDTELVAVTPSALDYHAMTAADVCVLRLADLSPVEGERTPSVESSLHARVLRAKPDMGCSIHTHQPVASACALIGRTLEVPHAMRASLGTHVPVVGYAPSGSGWLASRLHRTLEPGVNAYLMRNHGILCCGRDSAAAMQAVDDLESVARTLLSERISAQASAHATTKSALLRVNDALLGRAFL